MKMAVPWEHPDIVHHRLNGLSRLSIVNSVPCLFGMLFFQKPPNQPPSFRFCWFFFLCRALCTKPSAVYWKMVVSLGPQQSKGTK
jgi:hypothetical protein